MTACEFAVMPTVFVNTVCDAPGTTGIVPDVVGQDLNIAYEALRDAGLVLALPIVSDRTPVVTGQSPEPGTQHGCGDVLLTTDPGASTTWPTTSAGVVPTNLPAVDARDVTTERP